MKKSADFINEVSGKTITSLKVEHDILYIGLGDNTLEVWDDGQDCCEVRYLHTDDKLSDFVGHRFIGIDIVDYDGAELIANHDAVHDMQFCLIRTSLGTFTLETHNEHSGYYGGFSMKCKTSDYSEYVASM